MWIQQEKNIKANVSVGFPQYLNSKYGRNGGWFDGRIYDEVLSVEEGTVSIFRVT